MLSSTSTESLGPHFVDDKIVTRERFSRDVKWRAIWIISFSNDGFKCYVRLRYCNIYLGLLHHIAIDSMDAQYDRCLTGVLEGRGLLAHY